MDKFELIWSRVTRVASFCGGIAIMFFETVKDQNDRPWLYAAAVGMMGLPIARAAENVLGRISGTGPQILPSKEKVYQPVDSESAKIQDINPGGPNQ